MEPRKPYPTDLNDKEWDLIKHLVPAAKPGGRPAKYPKREILDAIFSILRGGCAWRLLPHDFPPWQMVYQYFWRSRNCRGRPQDMVEYGGRACRMIAAQVWSGKRYGQLDSSAAELARRPRPLDASD